VAGIGGLFELGRVGAAAGAVFGVGEHDGRDSGDDRDREHPPERGGESAGLPGGRGLVAESADEDGGADRASDALDHVELRGAWGILLGGRAAKMAAPVKE